MFFGTQAKEEEEKKSSGKVQNQNVEKSHAVEIVRYDCGMHLLKWRGATSCKPTNEGRRERVK